MKGRTEEIKGLEERGKKIVVLVKVPATKKNLVEPAGNRCTSCLILLSGSDDLVLCWRQPWDNGEQDRKDEGRLCVVDVSPQNVEEKT